MNKRRILILLAALFLLFVLWRIITLIFAGSNEAQKVGGQLPVAVEVDTVRYEAIEEIRQFTGSVYPIYQYVLLRSQDGC